MDVRLSSEQQALRDSVVRLVGQRGPAAVAEIGEPVRGATLDSAVAAAGWRELRDGTDDGGPLASAVETALIAEELGRGLADVAFLGPVLAAEFRRLAGAGPGLTTETVVLDAGLRRPATADDSAVVPSVAVDTAGSSRALLLMAEGDVYAVGQIDLPESGVGETAAGVDLTRPSVPLVPPLAVTRLSDVTRPLTADDVRRWTAFGLSLTCADLVGTMAGAVQLAVDYAQQRRQYGAVIGSFQAVQHMLADAFVATEGARSVTRHAAWAVDALAPGDALAAAAAAKAYCARAARAVCETAIQVHGGIGNTWDCLAHVYLRRALLLADILGDAERSLALVLQHRGIGSAEGTGDHSGLR